MLVSASYDNTGLVAFRSSFLLNNKNHLFRPLYNCCVVLTDFRCFSLKHFWSHEVLSLQAARMFESQLAESILEGDGQLAFKKLATATLETLMPRIEGKGEFGQARWRLVYAPQIPSLLSLDPSVDPLKSLANNISSGTEVEVQLGKRLQVYSNFVLI